MFPYRAKYNESESDIQNNDLLYKINQTCKNTFELLDFFLKISKIHIFQKSRFQNDQRFMAICMARLWRA